MSYTNPKQYIDTQSAKSIIDLQRSVSDSYSSLAKQRSQYLEKQRIQQQREDKEREKEDKANRKQAAKKQANLASDFEKAVDNNDSRVNTMSLTQETINEYAKIVTLNEVEPSTENIKKQAYYQGVPDKIRAGLEVVSSVWNEDYDERVSNTGIPGGVSKYNNIDFEIVGESVTDDDPYYEKRAELDERGKIIISFINKDGFYKTWPQGHPKEGERIIADVSSIESADTAIVIPDYSKTISAIDKDINEQLGIGRKEGEAYRESNLLNKAGIPGQTIYYKEADMGMIRKKYEKKIETEYFENGAEGMIAFYNNIVPKESKEDDKVIENKKGKSWQRNDDNEIDDPDYNKVKNALVNYMLERNEKLYQNLVVGSEKAKKTTTKTGKERFNEKQVAKLNKNWEALKNPKDESFSFNAKFIGPDDINIAKTYTFGIDGDKIIATDTDGNQTVLENKNAYYDFLGIELPSIGL